MIRDHFKSVRTHRHEDQKARLRAQRQEARRLKMFTV
jgi:hypothetical protein